MKKVLSILLSICLVMAFLSFTAFADGTKKSGLFSYEIKGNGTAIITDFDWSSNGGQDVYVPNMVDGYTVTEIGELAFNRHYQIPENYYYYGMEVLSDNDAGAPASMINEYLDDFSNNSDEYFESLGIIGDDVVVVLPNTINVIGEKAFFATRITSINIPSSVKLIGSGAFACCPNIKAFSVDSGNETYATIDDVLYNKQQKELVCYPLGLGNPSNDISIPNGITSIGDYAFFDFPTKKEIKLPSSITQIGDYAFYGCYELSNGRSLGGIGGATKFNLPNSIETIGDYAFAYAAVNEFNWPTSLTQIGDYAFTHSMLYQKEGYGITLSLPSNLEQIGESAFAFSQSHYNGQLADALDLASTKLTNIPQSAFAGTRFQEIKLSTTIKVIEKEAFSSAIGKVNIPSSVEQINDNAFEYGGGNVSFSTDASLKSIGSNAFSNYHFNGQGTLTLPDGLEEIGSEAFNDTMDLTSLVIPDSVKSIGSNICNRADVKLEVSSGSYGAIWASENGYSTKSTGGDDTSWLND